MKTNDDSIQILSGAEAIRARPNLYVGDTTDPGLATILLQETLCVSIDNAQEGSCTRVEIEIDGDGSMTVTDNGPGWPVIPDEDGKCDAERYMTEINACSSAKHHRLIANTACTFGMACINALSESCVLTVWRDGFEWTQSYVCGRPTSLFARLEPSSHQGTRLHFSLDANMLTTRNIDIISFCAWLREHTVGLVVSVTHNQITHTIDMLTPHHYDAPAP